MINIDYTGKYYCKISFDAFSPFDTALVNVAGCPGGAGGAMLLGLASKQTPIVGESVKQAANMVCEVWDMLDDSIVFSAGIGQGYYCEVTLGPVGTSIGIYGNYAVLKYENDKWTFGQEVHSGALSTLLGQEFGFAEDSFRPNGGTYETSSYSWVNSNQDTITLWSSAAYCIAGYSISIGIKPVAFFEALDSIIFSGGPILWKKTKR